MMDAYQQFIAKHGCPICGSYEPGEEGWDWSMAAYGICEECELELEEGDEFEDCDRFEDDDEDDCD